MGVPLGGHTQATARQASGRGGEQGGRSQCPKAPPSLGGARTEAVAPPPACAAGLSPPGPHPTAQHAARGSQLVTPGSPQPEKPLQVRALPAGVQPPTPGRRGRIEVQPCAPGLGNSKRPPQQRSSTFGQLSPDCVSAAMGVSSPMSTSAPRQVSTPRSLQCMPSAHPDRRQTML